MTVYGNVMITIPIIMDILITVVVITVVNQGYTKAKIIWLIKTVLHLKEVPGLEVAQKALVGKPGQ